MAPIYRIAKWHETFEKSDAKKLKTLPWISVPTNMDSNGFVAMGEEFGDEAPAVYGAWIALCVFAAGCTEHGLLATSKGEAIPISRIARRTGWPVEVFNKLIAWATSQSIGWIEVIDGPAVPSEIFRESPDDLGKSPDYVTDETERNETKHNGRTDGAREDRPVAARPILFWDRWKEIRPHVESLHRAIEPTHDKLRKSDQALCFEFAAIRTAYPELEGQLMKIQNTASERAKNGSLDRPWGWIKSELIRACNASGVGYDRMIAVIDMRKHKPAASSGKE